MILSDHFKRSLWGIGIISAILLGLFFWMKHRIERVITILTLPGHATGLAADDKEVVKFNEKTHRVSVLTSSTTVKMYARNPTVHIKKDGRVVVDRHLFGVEMRPLLGLGYSDTTRVLVGLEPVYWGPFDASISAGVTLDKSYVFVKPYAAIGYNCWGNLSVNGGVNPTGVRQLDVIIFLSLKI